MSPLDEDDPTLVRNQPALSTSSGRSWLVVGGAVALISIVMLLLQVGRQPVLAVVGALVVALLYGGMGIARSRVVPTRGRLAVLAVLLIAMALWTMGVLLFIVAQEL